MANLNLYKTFVCVAEEKNLTKASNKLFVSQPAISNAIKELEKQLSCQLFIRKNKGVELTPYGEKLYEKCKSAIDRLEEVDAYFYQISKKQSGLIKIGVNTSNLNQLFYDSITEFLKTYPNAEISILRFSENELYEGLDSGKLNYIVVDSEFSKEDLDIITEFNIEYEFIGNKEYFEKFKNAPLSIKNITKENLILANKAYTSRNNIDESLNAVLLFTSSDYDVYSLEFTKDTFGLTTTDLADDDVLEFSPVIEQNGESFILYVKLK